MKGNQNERPFLSGDTCWRREHASRVAFLIDGETYYKHLRSALMLAERQVLILAWELHTEIPLLRGEGIGEIAEDGWPVRLGDVLERAVERNPELEVYINLWSTAILFALEREIFPKMLHPWRKSSRIHFVEDSVHPQFASHHQKVVVVDDRVGFAGGLDITGTRWDAHDHIAFDERRRNPNGSLNGPYHDIQMAVEGDAAVALGDLARERWRRVTGETIASPEKVTGRRWPASLTANVEDVLVAIARTEAAFAGHPEVREVERAFVESIRQARHCIFIEQQYFTSHLIADEIIKRLAEKDGPEVVLILPYGCPGKVQSAAMDVGRDLLLERIAAVDHKSRFAAYWAVVPGKPKRDIFDVSVYIHAKTMVIDDCLLRIGSANLANRSMGLDSECDLLLEAGGNQRTSEAIVHYKYELLSYLLNTGIGAIRAEAEKRNSLIATIEALRGGDRTLVPLDHKADPKISKIAPDIRLTDPDRPLDPDTAATLILDVRDAEVEEFPTVSEEEIVRSRQRWKGLAALVAGILAMALVWKFSPLAEWTTGKALLATLEGWGRQPFGALAALVAFTLLSLVTFPITALVTATALIFGPVEGTFLSLTGALASASIAYIVGRQVGTDTIRRFGGRAASAVSGRLRESGVPAIAVLHNIPLAPFVLVNLVCGASHVRYRDFALGTLLGMAPGTLALSIFGDSLEQVLRQPSLGRFVLVAGAVVLVLAIAHGVQRLAEQHQSETTGTSER